MGFQHTLPSIDFLHCFPCNSINIPNMRVMTCDSHQLCGGLFVQTESWGGVGIPPTHIFHTKPHFGLFARIYPTVVSHIDLGDFSSEFSPYLFTVHILSKCVNSHPSFASPTITIISFWSTFQRQYSSFLSLLPRLFSGTLPNFRDYSPFYYDSMNTSVVQMQQTYGAVRSSRTQQFAPKQIRN